MTNERKRRLYQIFDEALTLSPHERSAYLDQACAGDTALRQEVTSLLAAEEQASGFLKTPAPVKYADVLAQERGTNMSGIVTLRVVAGPMQGKDFFFSEHDIFIFGREKDCHARLTEKDTTVSRHHFLLEVNPPDARLRDMGSRNGTWVNGVKCGGREPHETPEQAAKRQFPEAVLKHGDEIRVGETVFNVQVEMPAFCCGCGVRIADNVNPAFHWGNDAFICPKCREDVRRGGTLPKAPKPMRCSQCGKDVSAEIGKGRRGDYVCQACQTEALANPAGLLTEESSQGASGAGSITKYEFDEVKDKIGAGGMGAVYKARRKQDGMTVALKMMLARVAVTDYMRQAFLREIIVNLSLQHRHLVQIFSHGSTGSGFFFVMEFCPGGSVEDLMKARGGKLSLREAGTIILQALDGLAQAHEEGFVHRDLKPANILLTSRDVVSGRGIVKVSDFGLAKSFEDAGLSGMTVTGATAGTPWFMAREQLTKYKYVKPVSDVWGMGATLYFMLTRQFPRDFPADHRLAFDAVISRDAVPIRQRDTSIPAKVAEVLDRALADEIENRYQTAAEFRKALAQVL